LGPKEFLGTLGNRVKFGAYGGEGWGINFLALDKSTYQILASYFDYNWFKKFVVGGDLKPILVFSLWAKTSTKDWSFGPS